MPDPIMHHISYSSKRHRQFTGFCDDLWTDNVMKKVLIANRGEIACRIVRACQKLDLASVAIHPQIETNALHVAQADEAILIEAAKPVASYLDSDAIVAAALSTGADAIHPGYGFLSENADFARAVEQAG